ncbi:MAG TPA: hypothetical protein VHE99_02920 [Gammaproteobacteria bacterium]|nr:hypothetical protein [Gammaproteobacteria bacterium]HVY53384.1 hypothetical protein [Gammaproteobacteria bacterium]
MKFLLTLKKIPDELRKFFLGFNLYVFLRVKIIGIVVLEYACAVLNSLVVHLQLQISPLKRLRYKVYWHYVVTEGNLAQVSEKIPFKKIRRLLQPGDHVWCASGYNKITDNSVKPIKYILYRSKTYKEFVWLKMAPKLFSKGAVGWGDKYCIEGYWVNADTICLRDDTHASANGYRTDYNELSSLWQDDSLYYDDSEDDDPDIYSD